MYLVQTTLQRPETAEINNVQVKQPNPHQMGHRMNKFRKAWVHKCFV